MQGLESATAAWRGAVAIVSHPDGDMLRPVVFLFDTPTGFAWVEPAYADPAGTASPALHWRDGELVRVGDDWLRPGLAFSAFDAADPGNDPDIAAELAWFAGYLAAHGRTWEQERERVRSAIGGDVMPAAA